MSVVLTGSTRAGKRGVAEEHARESQRTPGGSPLRGGADKGTVQVSGPTRFYKLDEFLSDHRHLAAACRLNLEPRPYVGGCADDRFVPIQPGLFRAWSDFQERAALLFGAKYGGKSGAVCRSRFLMVLRFLDDWNFDLAASGVARGHDPVEVHEDFIAFLLRYPLTTDRSTIPRSALVRFLDELGHQWM